MNNFKCLFLAIVIVISITLIGCTLVGEDSTNYAEGTYSVTFTLVGRAPGCDIYVCDQTKVLYAMNRGTYNYGTYTLLVSADGSPMLLD